jgi:sugar phosphate permease
MTQASKRRLIHPAWIAFGATFVTLAASAGYRAAPSVLIVPLQDAFGWSRSTISLAVSINVLLFGLTAPFAAALMERFTIRKVVMVALTTVGIGSISTIFMDRPWHLMLLWGVVVGVGTGSMALVFAANIANRWFIAKKGLVIGMLTAASASGQLIFLPTLSSLAIHHGWKSVGLTVGGASLVMVPLVYLFLKESPASMGVTPYGAPVDWTPPVVVKRNAAQEAINTLREASGHRDFWYLTLSFLVCGLSTSGLVGTHFIPASHDHGMSEVTAASLLAMIGIFDVVGTIFSGYLTDRIDPRKLLFFYYFLRGLSLFLLPSILFSSLHASTLVFIIFYGLDWVATVPPTIVLCRRILGPERATVVYGWVFTAHQVGGSIAASGAAILRVHFGNYALAFYIAGILCLASSYVVLQIGKSEKPEKSAVSV